MKIYRPIKSNRQGQKFGESRACSYPDNRVVSKIGNKCPQGSTSLYEKLGLKGHNGEDWGLWNGEPMYHCADWEGTMWTEIDRHGGIGVDVISDEPVVDGKRVKLRFWHLKGVYGHDGKKVKMGDMIGYGDSTGLSSGPHLHWSMKLVDKNGETLNKGNGYYGAVDFRPYFENKFVLDVIIERIRSEAEAIKESLDEKEAEAKEVINTNSKENKNMFKNTSMAGSGWAVMLIGLVVRWLGLDYDEGQVTEIATAVVIITGFVSAGIGQIRRGDLKLGLFRR